MSNQMIIENLKWLTKLVLATLSNLSTFITNYSISIVILTIWILIGTLIWWKWDYQIRKAQSSDVYYRYTGVWQKKEERKMPHIKYLNPVYDPINSELLGWDMRYRWWFVSIAWPIRIWIEYV